LLQILPVIVRVGGLLQMTVYNSELSYDYKPWLTPEFKLGDLIKDCDHLYLVVKIKQESLFLCLDENNILVWFIPSSYCKYEILSNSLG
jgi:hypothetical protein